MNPLILALVLLLCFVASFNKKCVCKRVRTLIDWPICGMNLINNEGHCPSLKPYLSRSGRGVIQSRLLFTRNPSESPEEVAVLVTRRRRRNVTLSYIKYWVPQGVLLCVCPGIKMGSHFGDNVTKQPLVVRYSSSLVGFNLLSKHTQRFRFLVHVFVLTGD